MSRIRWEGASVGAKTAQPIRIKVAMASSSRPTTKISQASEGIPALRISVSIADQSKKSLSTPLREGCRSLLMALLSSFRIVRVVVRSSAASCF
jgi:hypothetical protein